MFPYWSGFKIVWDTGLPYNRYRNRKNDGDHYFLAICWCTFIQKHFFYTSQYDENISKTSDTLLFHMNEIYRNFLESNQKTSAHKNHRKWQSAGPWRTSPTYRTYWHQFNTTWTKNCSIAETTINDWSSLYSSAIQSDRDFSCKRPVPMTR